MLNPKEIKALIDADRNSERRKLAEVGQRYYDAKHDILDYRMFYYNDDGDLVEDTTSANARIPHPFFTELADQLAPYMLSFEENPIRAKLKDPQAAADLQEHLDAYFDDDFWSEIGDLITGSYVKGVEYLYAYKNEDDRLAFQCADSMGVIEVRAKDTDSGAACMLYWYTDRIDKGKKKIIRVQAHTSDSITFYVQNGENGRVVLDDEVQPNPRPNVVYTDSEGKRYGKPLGFIPFWPLPLNKKRVPGLMPIKRIIDDYDLMKCGLSNNLQDFDHPIYAVKGFDGHDFAELAKNLRTKKMVGTGEQGGIDVVAVEIPVEARKANLETDERNIYKFGMGFNASQVGDGNITNVVIRSRYTLLDLKADKVEKPLKKMLKKNVIPVVLEEINAEHGTAYLPGDVEIKFERIIPTNESEDIENEHKKAQTKELQVNTILNAAASIGDEATLEAICDVMDWDLDKIQAKLKEAQEETPEAAEAILEQVVTDDEPEAETGPAVPAG